MRLTSRCTSASRFPERALDPVLRAVSLLGNALAQTPSWATTITLPHWLSLAGARPVQSEINELVALIDYRPAVLDEALTERLDIVQYWAGLLMFNQGSKPNTNLLARLAIEAGAFFAMHFKAASYTELGGTVVRPRPRHRSSVPG